MALTEKLMWKLYAGVLGALTTLVAKRAYHGRVRRAPA